MENNHSHTLHDNCQEYLKMKPENMKCKCNQKDAYLKKHIINEEIEGCSLCQDVLKDILYSCSPPNTSSICTFKMCQDCFLLIAYMKKSEIVFKILKQAARLEINELLDYVRSLYRFIFHDNTIAQKSIIVREGAEYKIFEVYKVSW